MSSTICVTGGAGFIGSHVADALVAAGHRVLIVDDLSSGRKENVPSDSELHVLDVRSEEAGQLLVDRKVEVLVHHAAQMDVRRSVADPLYDADVNILGLLNLLEAARGGHSEYGLDVTCLRYANVYGPRQNPHGEAGVVAIFSRLLLDGEKAVINGDGLQTRDYVYVDDIVRANLASLDRPGFSTYNVGTGVETDVNTLFNHIAEAANFDAAPTHGPAAAGEQRRSCISSERMLEELSVAVDTPLSDGISNTVAWFRET